MPASRPEYWIPKLTRNVTKDSEHSAALRRLGWKVLIIWECEIRDTGRLIRKLQRFLGTEY
jgi:DNA mismatch endonuclease (patch repair protein)